MWDNIFSRPTQGFSYKMKTHDQAVKTMEDFLQSLPTNYPRLITCSGTSFHASDGKYYTGSFNNPKDAYMSVQSLRVKSGLPVTMANSRTRKNDNVIKKHDRSKSYTVYLDGAFKAKLFFWIDVVSMFDLTLNKVEVQKVKEKTYTTPRNQILTVIFD